jgi:hypothetical protein
MASSTYHTIVVRSNNPDNAVQRVREAKAGGAITPGMLCEINSSGDIVAHVTQGGPAKGRLVALENPWSDHGSGPAIDHAYATGETVRYIRPQPGDQLYMIAEASAALAIGDPLGASDTAGLLEEITISATTLADSVIGYAAEAVTVGAGTTGRVLVDIA